MRTVVPPHATVSKMVAEILMDASIGEPHRTVLMEMVNTCYDEGECEEVLVGGIRPRRSWDHTVPTDLHELAMAAFIDDLTDPQSNLEDSANQLVAALFPDKEHHPMARRNHVASSPAGTGKSAGQGLARFRNAMKKTVNELDITGVALDMYRKVVKVQDAVLKFLARAAELTKGQKALEEATAAARAELADAVDAYRESQNGIDHARVEKCRDKVEACRKAESEAKAEKRDLTALIRSVNGFLGWFDAEVRKNYEVKDERTGLVTPGETHRERKARTKRFLIKLADMPGFTANLEVPDLQVMALLTGETQENLRKKFCGPDGKEQYRTLPEEVTLEALMELGAEQDEQQQTV